MAGLLTFSLAGLGFLLIAAVESLAPSLFAKPSLPFLRNLSAAALSSLFVLDALISAVSSLRSAHDPLGPALPLSTLPAAALFLLHSLAGLLSLIPRPPSAPLLPVPSSLLDLLLLSAFIQELLLLLSFRRKDPDGLENRYLELLLVPAALCAAATLAAAARPRSAGPRLARAAGLALHGTWLIQMAFSFFSTAMAHGCSLHRRSRSNYTIQCKGHADDHRSRAIATLQFNCHLAFLVFVGVGVYSAVARRSQRVDGGPRYRPLNKELQRIDRVSSQFTLDSDDEGEEIVAESNISKQHNDIVLPISGANGLGGSH